MPAIDPATDDPEDRTRTDREERRPRGRDPLPARRLPPWVTDPDATLFSRVAAAPGLLCCLDFDGTLAPIVDDPDAAAIDPACRRAVEGLAGLPTVRVGIVSGRALADLRDRIAVDGVALAGNHGLEVDFGDGPRVCPGAADDRAVVGSLCESVTAALADVPGVVVEDKGVTATIHHRRVPTNAVERVRTAVFEAVERAERPLEVVEGKAILEVRPAIDRHKGHAVAALAETVPEDWLVCYVGDDTTDEDAFETVEPAGVGVHVGRDPTTAASHRLPDAGAVAGFLRTLAAVAADDRSP